MKQFNILKGRHYSRWRWTKLFHPRWNHKKWSLVVILGEGWWWDKPRNNDDYDLDKIYGTGFGFDHHKNSWRLACRPNFIKKNTVFVYGYTYDTREGKHVSKELGEHTINKPYKWTIESIDGKYRFINLDLGIKEDMLNTLPDCRLQFDLSPYAGGNNVSKDDRVCWIEFKPL